MPSSYLFSIRSSSSASYCGYSSQTKPPLAFAGTARRLDSHGWSGYAAAHVEEETAIKR
jgi:hypothetical protein